MHVKFNLPVTSTVNPFLDFQPSNLLHYPNGNGIYIYGFKKIISGKLCFIPIYVGIAKDLKTRLWQHYCEERSGGNSKWYVFDYAALNSIKDVRNLYSDMLMADSKKRFLSRFSKNLIWFNNNSFFDFKLGLKNGSNYISNSGVLSSILPNGDLDNIDSKYQNTGAKSLKQQIIKSKAIFDDNYFFMYSNLKSDIIVENKHPLSEIYRNYMVNQQYMDGRKNGYGKQLAESIEMGTKFLLRKINISTCAKAHGILHDITIDFSDIQDNLINLGGHSFSSNNSYINPLILY